MLSIWTYMSWDFKKHNIWRLIYWNWIHLTIWCLFKARIYSLLVKLSERNSIPMENDFLPSLHFIFHSYPTAQFWWHPFSPYIDPIYACMLSVHLITIVCVCDYLTSGHKIKATIALSSWHTSPWTLFFSKNFFFDVNHF